MTLSPSVQLDHARAAARARYFDLPAKLREACEDVITRGQRLGEHNDPERTLRELFGTKLTRDLEIGLEALHSSTHCIGYGCHNSGKTAILGGQYLVGERWFVQGCELDAAGNPKGAILALIANKEDQILKTSWQAVKKWGRLAAANGWVLPGWGPEVESAIKVRWTADPVNWYMTAQTAQFAARGSGIHQHESGAGLKHDHRRVIAWCEELGKLPPQMFVTIDGWSLGLVVGFMNPYNLRGKAYEIIAKTAQDAAKWTTFGFSYLRHPNVLRRDPDHILGACPHSELEEAMRVGGFELQPKTDTDGKLVTPDPKHHDILYALPKPGTPEPKQPFEGRADGVPGHPDAEPRVWRPGYNADAGLLGNIPLVNELSVFSPAAWREAVELGRQLTEPERPPDVVGVDCAEGGPDRFVAVPRWGPSAVELWKRYQVALRPQGDKQPTQAEALDAALKCSTCGGEGCPQCFGGKRLMYFGQEVPIPKIHDTQQMAKRITAKWGGSPLYNLDSSGGYWIVPALRSLCRVKSISFGGSGGDEIEGQKLYENQRARMYGALSYVITLPGAVALPPSTGQPTDVAAGCRPLQWEEAARSDKSGGKKVVWKLQDKLGVKAAIGSSPDASDAFAVTEGEEKKVGGGGSSWDPGW